MPVLLSGIICLVVVFWARPAPPKRLPTHDSPATTSVSADVGFSPAGSLGTRANKAAAPTFPAVVDTEVVDMDSAPEKEAHEEFVNRRTAELMDLAMTEDSSSLTVILSELNNPDPEIRAAAVTAAVQFKSTDAIPALQSAYDAATEPEEKLRIRDAMDFLSLLSDTAKM